ncbi:MAG TPA: glycosyltransferase, partial [Candidatus Binataceae bacterium]
MAFDKQSQKNAGARRPGPQTPADSRRARPLRIAQLASLYERIPPNFYGGTERVVSYLTEELVRRGHEVTLFASGDSITSARLVSGFPRSLRLAGLSS